MQTPGIMGEFWDVYCHNIPCSILYLLLTRNALGNMSNDPSTKTHIAYVRVCKYYVHVYIFSMKLFLQNKFITKYFGKKEERWVVMIISKCSSLLSSLLVAVYTSNLGKDEKIKVAKLMNGVRMRIENKNKC